MYVIQKFDGRGKLLFELETEILSLAKLYALHNATGKRQIFITDAETGEVLYAIRGTGVNSFPEVLFDKTKEIIRKTAPTL